MLENAPQEKNTETLKNTTGRQGKKEHEKSKIKRELERNIIRKGKMKAIMLDGSVMTAENHKQEDDVNNVDGVSAFVC